MGCPRPPPPATLAAPGCAAPGPPRPGVGLPAGPRGGPRPPQRESPAPLGGGAAGAPGATGPCPQRSRRGDAGAAGSTDAGDGAPGGPSSPGAYRGATPAPWDNQPPVPLPPTGPTRRSPRPRPYKPRHGWRSPERYYERRSEERSSGHRAPAARGRDFTPDRRDDRPRRDPPGSTPGAGRERRGPDDRRRRRSPSPDTARRLRYDAPDTGRRPQWEPRTAPDAQPPHVPKDKPPRKRQRHNKEGRQPAAQSPAGTPHRLPAHALAGTQTTPGLLAPRAQQARPPQDGAPRTPQKHRAGVTQTTPSLRGPGYAPPTGATQAPQQPRTADPRTVLHIRRLPTGWSHRHLTDRFMWLDGAEGVAEAFHGGENHGYLTFCAHTRALAACAVVSAALGTIAPLPGRLPAAIHCVSRSVVRGLTVHTRQDAQGEERQDTPSAGAAPPARRPPLPHGGRRPAPHSRCREQAAAGGASTAAGARPGTNNGRGR